MIRPLLLALAPLVTIAVPAHAQTADPRLATRHYDPNQVVRLEGRTGVQAAIAFADEEHIENVAIGDSNLWQVTPNKRANMLFVKPLTASARTNMTVVTDKRSYVFDLAASPAARPIYVLRFTYPAEPKPAPQPTLSSAEAQALAKPPVDPAQLNFAWAPKGKPTLLPQRVYDDGESTFLSWPAGQPVPAILVQNEAGVEGPVNYAVRDDVIVVDGVPALIVLRLGKAMAMLENRGAAPKPVAPAASPGLAAATDTAAPPLILPAQGH
ncbi:MAG TPA: TrbG/VirB9 family P-type conjugative transfer protein [Novosphingobium sp.]